MHSTESRFVIRPSNILFGGVYVCMFTPGNFTGWGSEGVNCFKTSPSPGRWSTVRLKFSAQNLAVLQSEARCQQVKNRAQATWSIKAKELRKSRSGPSGLPVPSKPRGVCGRKATLNQRESNHDTESTWIKPVLAWHSRGELTSLGNPSKRTCVQLPDNVTTHFTYFSATLQNSSVQRINDTCRHSLRAFDAHRKRPSMLQPLFNATNNGEKKKKEGGG